MYKDGEDATPIYEVIFNHYSACYEVVNIKIPNGITTPLGMYIRWYNMVVLHSKFDKEVEV